MTSSFWVAPDALAGPQTSQLSSDEVIQQVKDRVAAVAGYAYDQNVCKLTIVGTVHTHCSNAGALTLITAAEEDQADIGTGE